MRIGVVAPARAIDPLVAARTRAFAAIAYPEVDLVFHPQCFVVEGHFAGSDAVRAAAFLEFANDPAFAALWFARGGYGSNRILDAILPQMNGAARAKTYLGYSDMGFVLGALYARRIGRPAHGPMPIDIGRDGGDLTVDRALAWLTERAPRASAPSIGDHPAAAFNLSILSAMVGTPYVPDLADHVLMIEDLSEPLYRIDRMLFQIGNAAQLRGVAGIRMGAFTDLVANVPEFGETPEQMVVRWCRDLGVPYLGRAEIGHTADNHVVPFGLA